MNRLKVKGQKYTPCKPEDLYLSQTKYNLRQEIALERRKEMF